MPPWPEIKVNTRSRMFRHHTLPARVRQHFCQIHAQSANLRSYHGKVWDWSKVRDFLKSQWSVLFTSVKAVLDRRTDFGTVPDGRRLGSVTIKCRWDSRQILGQERDTGGQLIRPLRASRIKVTMLIVFMLRCWHLGKLRKGTWEFFVPTIFGNFLKSEMISKWRVKTFTFKMRGREWGRCSASRQEPGFHRRVSV